MRALVYTQLFHLGPDRRKHNKLITHTNGQIFILKKINFARASRCFIHFLSSLHDFDVKTLNCTFYGGRKQATTNSFGGSVAELSAWRTRNPAVPGSIPVPLWPLAGFVLGRPEFKSSATLVNSQLVQSLASWGFSETCYVLFASFGAELFKGSACKLAG